MNKSGSPESISHKKFTIIFPVEDGEYVLGMKKRGFGSGWWNGFGGKLEPGESYEQAAIRETKEEVGLKLTKLNHIANLHFLVDGKLDGVSRAYAADYSGEPEETEEMRPHKFKLNEFPYDQMWPGDDLWIPEVLDPAFIGVNGYKIYFDGENNFQKIDRCTPESLEYKF